MDGWNNHSKPVGMETRSVSVACVHVAVAWVCVCVPLNVIAFSGSCAATQNVVSPITRRHVEHWNTIGASTVASAAAAGGELGGAAPTPPIIGKAVRASGGVPAEERGPPFKRRVIPLDGDGGGGACGLNATAADGEAGGSAGVTAP